MTTFQGVTVDLPTREDNDLTLLKRDLRCVAQHWGRARQPERAGGPNETSSSKYNMASRVARL